MHKILLLLHIITGSVSLLLGAYILVRRKGDLLHRRLGLVFYYMMLAVSISSLGLAIIRPNHFLFMIGVFTFYMNVTGKRYIVAKNQGTTGYPADWTITCLMTAFGLVLLWSGITSLLRSETFGIVSAVFAVISLLMAGADFRVYKRRQIGGAQATSLHLQRMTATYIAALTAFLVVNLPGGSVPPALSFIPWLLPTAVLVPFIVKWSRRYPYGT